MAMITVDAKSVIATGKPITVSDPACGAGGMILALAEQFAPNHVDLLRVTIQDLNPVATDMGYINMTLWGIPSAIICGDTLRGTIDKSWKNIHWHRVGEDERQAIEQMLDFIRSPQTQKEEKIADVTMPSPSFQTGEQFELKF